MKRPTKKELTRCRGLSPLSKKMEFFLKYIKKKDLHPTIVHGNTRNALHNRGLVTVIGHGEQAVLNITSAGNQVIKLLGTHPQRVYRDW